MNKKNKPIWGTRIKGKTSGIFEKVSSSLKVDKRLYKEDILASITHVEMLNRQKIINFKIKNKIIWGLKKIQNQIIKKNIYLTIEMKIYT